MSSQILYRLSGIALIAGSVLLLIGAIAGAILFPGQGDTPQQVLSPSWTLVTLLNPLGSLLFVIGLPGMYLRQSGRAGRLGIAGFSLLFFATVLGGVAFIFVEIVALPLLAQLAPHQLAGEAIISSSSFLLLLISTLMDMIGAVVLGIATVRARVFPRWTGVLLVASGILTLILFFTAGSPLGDIIGLASTAASAVVFVWCGYLLMGRERASEEVSPLASASVRVSR